MNAAKKIFLALSACLLLFFGVFFLSGEEAAGMDYRYLSPKQYQKLIENLQPDETLSYLLCFRGETIAHSGESSFLLPVDMEEAQWEVGSLGAADNTEIFFLEDFKRQKKQKLVGENHPIPFVAVQGSRYQTGTLYLTGLPVLSFEMTELLADDGNPLFEMALYEPCGQDEWVTKTLATAQIRGNTSKEYEKKSLRLKLKKEKKDGSFVGDDKNLLGIRKDDDWILNSLYADNTRIRDKLCMDLWQECGAWQNPYQVNFGVQGEYVEVVIGGGYTGLYLLTHPVDAKQLKMDKISEQIEAGSAVIERIYKKKYTAAWDSSDFTGPFPDPNLNDFRGGFFLKGDAVFGQIEEWEPLCALARCMEADDTAFAEQITALVDTENVADNWLFFQAIGGFDNENKNVYYIARNRNNAYYGYFIPWDMNLSFGSVYTDNRYYSEESMEEVEQPVCFEPGMRMVMLDAAGSRAYVRRTWERWRRGAFDTEALLVRMDELQQLLVRSGAFAREMERWQDGNADPDISLMKEYARRRLAFVDSYVEGLK